MGEGTGVRFRVGRVLPPRRLPLLLLLLLLLLFLLLLLLLLLLGRRLLLVVRLRLHLVLLVLRRRRRRIVRLPLLLVLDRRLLLPGWVLPLGLLRRRLDLVLAARRRDLRLLGFAVAPWVSGGLFLLGRDLDGPRLRSGARSRLSPWSARPLGLGPAGGALGVALLELRRVHHRPPGGRPLRGRLDVGPLHLGTEDRHLIALPPRA